MQLDSFKPGVALNVLLKGDPGTGKTPIACSFPTPLLLFDCDFRARSLNLFFKNDPERIKQIEVVQPKSFEEVRSRLELIASERKPRYKTIVVDPLTTFADMTMRNVLEIKGAGRKIGNVKVAGIQDYGDESAILNEVIYHLRNIYQTHSINTILVAHVVTSEEKDLKEQKTVYSRSLLTGGKKIGSKLPSYFDEVWHTYVRSDLKGRPEFVLQTRHTGFDFARTGLDLPDELVFSNYEHAPEKFFYEAIKKYLPNSEEYLTRVSAEDKIIRQTELVVDDKTQVVEERPVKIVQ